MIMNDLNIRHKFKSEQLKTYYQQPNTMVLDELGLSFGESRIDIAVIGNKLLGFELKSDLDNLARLPRQIRFYNAVFDEVTLVVGYTHAYDALKIIPRWWGVVFVECNSEGDICFSYARDTKQNPSPNKITIAKLLWKDEALKLLEELEGKSYRSKSRSEICKQLAYLTDYEDLRSKVCNQLKRRVNWRADEEQVSYAY